MIPSVAACCLVLAIKFSVQLNLSSHHEHDYWRPATRQALPRPWNAAIRQEPCLQSLHRGGKTDKNRRNPWNGLKAEIKGTVGGEVERDSTGGMACAKRDSTCFPEINSAAWRKHDIWKRKPEDMNLDSWFSNLNVHKTTRVKTASWASSLEIWI